MNDDSEHFYPQLPVMVTESQLKIVFVTAASLYCVLFNNKYYVLLDVNNQTVCYNKMPMYLLVHHSVYHTQHADEYNFRNTGYTNVLSCDVIVQQLTRSRATSNFIPFSVTTQICCSKGVLHVRCMF